LAPPELPGSGHPLAGRLLRASPPPRNGRRWFLAEPPLQVTRLHRRGFPCYARFPLPRMPAPLPRWTWLRCRSCPGCYPGTFLATSGGLRRDLSGSASTSNISRLARRSLTFRPACSQNHGIRLILCLEGSDGFVTSTAAPIATGWSDPLPGEFRNSLETANPRRTKPLRFVMSLHRRWPCVALDVIVGTSRTALQAVRLSAPFAHGCTTFVLT
jgi:hypothetical protein